MRIYHDWEFIEDGRTVDPISVGMVAEDGREYYAVFSDAPWERVHKHEWLMTNVWPHLPLVEFAPEKFDPAALHDPLGRHLIMAPPFVGRLDLTDPVVKPGWVIRNEVRQFITSTADAEMWGWYSAYDHVVLAQMFGPMAALPSDIPKWTNDVRQEVARLGGPRLPERDGVAHHALADARHIKAMHEFVLGLDSPAAAAA
ncbi:3'-5' exoribonuclease domain-containing protein [Microtetraspora fusca]|uniref:3'-5' exoribonuclease domain-containing protein n=1 Tax=Microtetraspora fusca TaxID=1997 RepID=A0ABW6VH02_MICFU